MSLTPYASSGWGPWASPRCVNWAGLVMTPGAFRARLPPSGLMRLCFLSWVLCRGALPSWQDLAVLQDKLRISTKKLEEYETLFKCQEETTQKLVLEYQARLEEGEERLRRQQEDKDIQMKGIISR